VAVLDAGLPEDVLHVDCPVPLALPLALPPRALPPANILVSHPRLIPLVPLVALIGGILASIPDVVDVAPGASVALAGVSVVIPAAISGVGVDPTAVNLAVVDGITASNDLIRSSLMNHPAIIGADGIK